MKRFKLFFALSLLMVGLGTHAQGTPELIDGVWYRYLWSGEFLVVAPPDGEAAYSGAVVIPNVPSGKSAMTTCIAAEAFAGSAITSVVLPRTLTTIGLRVFKGCNDLTSITVDTENSNFCDQNGILFSKDMTTLYAFPAAKADEFYVIPTTVTSLADYAFAGCKTLSYVAFHEGLTAISESAFMDCSALTTVFIPNGCTSIAENAFANCTALEDLTITPVTSIAGGAFAGCTGMKQILCLNTTLPTVGEDAFKDVPHSAFLIVPTAAVEDYRSTEPWKAFRVIEFDLYVKKAALNEVLVDMDMLIEFAQLCEIPESAYSDFSAARDAAALLNEKDLDEVTVAELTPAISNAYAAIDAAVAGLLTDGKDALKAQLDNMLLPDDDSECQSIIIMAKLEVDKLAWNTEATYSTNIVNLKLSVLDLLESVTEDLNKARYLGPALVQLRQLCDDLYDIRSLGYVMFEDTDPIFIPIDEAMSKARPILNYYGAKAPQRMPENGIIKRTTEPTFAEVQEAVSTCEDAKLYGITTLVPAVIDEMKTRIGYAITEEDGAEAHQVVADAQEALTNFTWDESLGTEENTIVPFRIYFAAMTDLEIAKRRVTADNITNQSATINWALTGTTFDLRYKKALIMDFESGMAPFTALDADGDGFNWFANMEKGGENPADGGMYIGLPTHGGQGIAYSQSGHGSGLALTPDNWLISPLVKLGGSITFHASGIDYYLYAEHFGVFISVSGTEPDDFYLVNEWTPSDDNFAEYSADYPLVSGTGYVAIRHFDCTDQFILAVDDIEIYEGPKTDWVEVNDIEAKSYQLTGLEQDSYYSVQVSADGGTTWSNIGVFKTTDEATAIDHQEDANYESAKMIRNGQLLIRRAGKTYNAQGAEVR